MNNFLNWLIGQNRDSPKRIFISFDIADIQYRDYLVGQAKNKNSTFYFQDWSAKYPWHPSEWKRKCQAKINKCCGMIVLMGNGTFLSSGVKAEVQMARKAGIPILALLIRKNVSIQVPRYIKDKEICTWSWGNILSFLNKI